MDKSQIMKKIILPKPMKSPNPKLLKGLFQDIRKLRETHEFEDFQVKIDNTSFTCHSFILATYSEFFRCLLRTDMKEKNEMKVELKNISSSIFELILNSLYTGCELLTKENVLEVWSAVHQLQIQFLIEHCEDFVIENVSLDTVESYKTNAEFFHSQKVSTCIYNFVLKNFETLKDKEMFFHFDSQYLERLLQSDYLQVSSEDEVLNSIFKWASYNDVFVQRTTNEPNDAFIDTIHDINSNTNIDGLNQDNSSLGENGTDTNEEQKLDVKEPVEPNERHKCLIQLLKSTRHNLTSEKCILKLHKHYLAQNDIFVREILCEALVFNLSDHFHGHWPTAAIQRNFSNLEHVGVFCDEGGISALSLKQDKWFTVPDLKKLTFSKLIVLKGKLFACSIGRADNEIYVLKENCWILVTCLTNEVHAILAHEKFIYLLDKTEKVFRKLNPDRTPVTIKKFRHGLENVEFALSFNDNILVFCSVDNKGLEETSVYCWNTEKNEWTQLDNIEFSCKNMNSFRNDTDTFILDSNGNLLKLTNTEIIGFKNVAKLWSVRCNIKGAVLFRKTLHILVESPHCIDILQTVTDVYSKTDGWFVDYPTSNFVHYAIPKSEIKLIQNY